MKLGKCVEWYSEVTSDNTFEDDNVCYVKSSECSNEFAIRGSEYSKCWSNQIHNNLDEMKHRAHIEYPWMKGTIYLDTVG